MIARRIGTVVAVTLMAGSAVALAQTGAPKKPIGKLTCEEFLAFEETVKPKVVYWAVAYGQGGRPESAVLDIEATERSIPVIIEKCKAAPKASFLKQVKAESGKGQAKTK